MHTVTFSDARKHFADTMSHVTNNAEPVRVMRRDAPDIVMVDAGEYEAMLRRSTCSAPRRTLPTNESLAQLSAAKLSGNSDNKCDTLCDE